MESNNIECGRAAIHQLQKRTKQPMLASASVAAILLVAGATMTPALAQSSDATQVEAVTVTGSRIISDIAQSPTPLTLVTADALQATTPTDIPDALGKLPVFMGDRSQINVQNGSSNAVGNVLNLRNFGASRTLVLLDGHRVAPSNADGTVDIDTLPQMLMSRVDVVTGGASAIYGSDAVAGVVNFVLDKKFDGFKYNVNAGISKYGDAAEYQTGLAAGTDLFGGRGHLEGSLRYYHQDGVPISARPYGFNNQSWEQTGTGTAANPFVSTPFGRDITRAMNGTIYCSCAAAGMTFTGPGVIGPLVPGTTTGTAGLNSGGDGGYNQVTSYMASLRTAEAFGRFSYDLNDTTTAYINTSYSESGNRAFWSPTSIYSPSTSGRPNTFYANNPFLPATAQALLSSGNPTGTFVDAGYQFNKINGVSARTMGDTYLSNSVDRNLGLNVGVDGTVFGNFAWGLYYTHGESRQEEDDPNNTNNQKFMAAMDAVPGPNGTVQCYVATTAYANLYPGCVPMNIFGTSGPSQDAYKWFSQDTHYILTNVLDDLGANVSGPLFKLPAGEVKASLSGEMRWAQLNVQSNAVPTSLVDCTGLRLCTPNTYPLWTQNTAAAVSASNNVYEFATEVGVPLLRDIPLVQELTADIAGRYTNYSTSGEAETWKMGLDYHVNDTVRFRGTMSVDIRAPNLNDLYQPLLISSSGLTDLYTKVNASTQLHTQGNSSLTPEIAHTMTAGIVLTPDFIPGLTMSVDYYKINMSNAITSLNYGTTAIQNICISSNGTSPYCSLAVRPLPWGNSTPANFPSYIIAESLNSAKVRTEGLDFEVDYSFELQDIWDKLPGSINLRHLMSLQPYITTTGFPGATPSFSVMPKGRMTSFLTYDMGDWKLNLQNTWLSGFSKASAPGQVYAVPRVNSFDTLDVSVDRTLDLMGGTADLYLSVQNIGNTQPPLYPTNSSTPGLFYPATTFESALGRYFTIGIKGNL